MSLRKKYSLKENLYMGRGLKLLKEEDPARGSNAWQGHYTEIVAGACIVKGSAVIDDADVLANLPVNATAEVYNSVKDRGAASGLFAQSVTMGDHIQTLANNMEADPNASDISCIWSGMEGKGETTADLILKNTVGSQECQVLVSLKSSQSGAVSANMGNQGNFGFKSEYPEKATQIQTAMVAEVAKVYRAAGEEPPRAGYQHVPKEAGVTTTSAEARDAAHLKGVELMEELFTEAEIKGMCTKLAAGGAGVVIIGPDGVIPKKDMASQLAMEGTFSIKVPTGEKGANVYRGDDKIARFSGPRFGNADSSSIRIDIQPRFD